MRAFGDVDLTQDHCLITVNHPCTLMPLHRAPLGKGIYPIQGDVRPRLCRHQREKRMLSAGIFTVEFVQGQNLSARTESAPTTLTQDTTHATAVPAPPAPTFESPNLPTPPVEEETVVAAVEEAPEPTPDPEPVEEAPPKSEGASAFKGEILPEDMLLYNPIVDRTNVLRVVDGVQMIVGYLEGEVQHPFLKAEADIVPEPPPAPEEQIEPMPETEVQETEVQETEVQPQPPAETPTKLVDVGARVDQSTEEPLVEDPTSIFGETEEEFGGEPEPPPEPEPKPRRRRRKKAGLPADSE